MPNAVERENFFASLKPGSVITLATLIEFFPLKQAARVGEELIAIAAYVYGGNVFLHAVMSPDAEDADDHAIGEQVILANDGVIVFEHAAVFAPLAEALKLSTQSDGIIRTLAYAAEAAANEGQSDDPCTCVPDCRTNGCDPDCKQCRDEDDNTDPEYEFGLMWSE